MANLTEILERAFADQRRRPAAPLGKQWAGRLAPRNGLKRLRPKRRKAWDR